LKKIRENINEQPINDRSVGGLAIRNLETWLLANTQTVSRILGVEIERLENLESLDDTKFRLEEAIEKSTYLVEEKQRLLKIRWNLAFQVDLAIIKTSCPNGYAAFTKDLIACAKVVTDQYLD